MPSAGVRLLLLLLLLPLRAGADEPRAVEAGALRLEIPARWRERRLRGKTCLRYTQFALRATPTDADDVRFFAEVPANWTRFLGPPPADFAVLHYGRRGKGRPEKVVRGWIAQFAVKGREIDERRVVEKDPEISVRAGTCRAGAYTLVDIRGTYYYNLAGWFRVEVELVPGVRMLCAIVETKDGPHYVKLTGRRAVVDRAEAEFRRALGLDARAEIPLDTELRRFPSAIRVRFELRGRPYAASGIRVRLDAREAVASDDGAAFESVPPGRHRLRIDRVDGHKALPEQEIDVREGRTTEVVLDLGAYLC
jgi:hypothetical protein